MFLDHSHMLLDMFLQFTASDNLVYDFLEVLSWRAGSHDQKCEAMCPLMLGLEGCNVARLFG